MLPYLSKVTKSESTFPKDKNFIKDVRTKIMTWRVNLRAQ